MNATCRKAIPVLAILAALACSKAAEKTDAKPAEQPRDLGTQVGDAGADTKTMHEANAAANSVIRAAGDCEAVKAALPAANAKLDDIAKQLRTATARTSLESIRVQVRHVAEACP